MLGYLILTQKQRLRHSFLMKTRICARNNCLLRTCSKSHFYTNLRITEEGIQDLPQQNEWTHYKIRNSNPQYVL